MEKEKDKENMQDALLNIGRKMVQEKGPEALTVRKLSEAAGCSVGAIYNQFANMDDFILVQNYMTLEALEKKLARVVPTSNPYADINRLMETFVDFVLQNKNLWFLLYNFHLHKDAHHYTFFYLRKVAKIVERINRLLERIVPKMERPERILSAQVLWLNLFALSAFLTKEVLDSFAKTDKRAVCQIWLNTYIAGLTVLEKK